MRLLLAPWTLLAAQALALEATEDEAQALDAVEVTAQKRPQRIQEVPVSLLLIDGEEITRQRLSDTSELGGQAANVSITKNTAEGTTPAVTVRGVGNLDYNTSTTSPIGVYLDGVGGGTANRHLMNLYDVESVEILRGPQGTLFGRNSTGGAILINTRRPEPNFGAYLNLGVGDFGRYQFGGALNVPLSEHSAMRLALDDQRYRYTVDNLHAPAPDPRMHQSEARWSLSAEFDALRVFAKIHAEDWSGVSTPVRHIGVIAQLPTANTPAVLCEPGRAGSRGCTDLFGFAVASDDLSDVSVNSETNGGSPHRRQSHGADLTLEYDLNENAYLVSIASFNTLDRIHHYNADASPARLLEGNLQVDGDIYSQELRFHQSFDQSYLIAGFYALKEPLTQDFFIDIVRDFRASPEAFGNAVKIFYDNRIDTASQALFLNLDHELSSDTTLTAGLRYTREQVDYRALGTFNIATRAGDFTGLAVPAWDVGGEVDDANFSGKLALNRRFNEQFNTWISVARGFKSGGYNGAIAFSAEEAERNAYGSEQLDAFEIGGNAFFSDLAVAFSMFYYDYQDQQVFMNTPSLGNGPPLQLLDNVGESRIYGAELELNWQPSEYFSARMGAGWLPKAELEEFTVAGGAVVRGNRLPFAPKLNLNALMSYTQPLAQGELQLQVQGNYQSESYFDQNQNPYTRQSGYSLLNARIGYQQGAWSLGLWAKNLADRSYSNLRFDVINFLGVVQDHRGARRQLGVDFNYQF